MLIDWIAGAAHEVTLFAAVGLLIGGFDDLLVDAIYLIQRVRHRRSPKLVLADLPPPTRPLALFVPVWHEDAVIGDMLRTALARWPHPRLTIYVGTYPNDGATIAAVADVARDDARVRLVVNGCAGPTTKADNLNAMWRALLRDEAAGDPRAAAVAFHDAEDVVHPGELHVYDLLIGAFDAVQLPVLPLADPHSRWVGGTYLDEFAESHAKLLAVRQAVGAGLPFAGVGCAVSRDRLARLADARGGAPFDDESLTEDYELGLAIAADGGRTVFAEVLERRGGPPVAVRALFPGTLPAAVRQKSRWMIGIALAGWDRVGWSRADHLAEHWMRMRDRRGPLGVVVLLAAYLALLLWAAGLVVSATTGRPSAEPGATLAALLWVNLCLLGWRAAVRAAFVWRAYGWAEAMRAVPRMFVSNLVALLAARRAVFRYAAMLRGAPLRWDKTDHAFPPAAELAR